MAGLQPQAQLQPPYGSVLLNELHTYFPAILYQRQRFTSVQDVLGYVEQQMRSRYDLFSGWQSHFQTANPLPQAQPPPQPPPQPQPYRQQQPHRQQTNRRYNRAGWYAMPETTTNIRVSIPPDTPTASADTRIDTLLNQYLPNDTFSHFIIRSILTGSSTPAGNTTTLNTQQPFWDNVPVVPTAAQISAASTTYIAPTALETPCAICQDTIAEGENVRKLSHCNHFFHRSCVDTWFQRNVQCPVCRHDIRSRTLSVQPQPQAQAPLNESMQS